MKYLPTLLLLFSNVIVFSQEHEISGHYKLQLDSNQADTFKYEITLFQNGTFEFHYYSDIKRGIPQETHKYGKGKWNAKDNLIVFTSDEKADFDQKYTLDFTNSKARYITKSTRDKTNKIVQTRLAFLKSEIPWLNRIDLMKL